MPWWGWEVSSFHSTSAVNILTSSSRQPQSESESSEFASMPASPCNATFKKQLPTSSPFYVRCTVSDDQFRRPCTVRSLSLSFCHGLTTTMLCWWAYQPYLCNCLQSVLIAQRCRAIHHRLMTLRPHHRHSPVPQSMSTTSWRQLSLVH